MMVVFLDVAGVSMYALGGSILRRVVSFLGSGVDNRRVSYDVTDVYRFDFLIGAIFDEMAFLSVL